VFLHLFFLTIKDISAYLLAKASAKAKIHNNSTVRVRAKILLAMFRLCGK